MTEGIHSFLFHDHRTAKRVGKSRNLILSMMFFLCGVFLPTSNANAGILYVGENGSCSSTPCYSRIQSAIDAAAYGDTVQVEAGTYNENITLKSEIDVLGAGAGLTTIQGTGTRSVITAQYIGSNSQIDGFRIIGGNSFRGGGFYLYKADITISNNIIENNSALEGGGIYSHYSAPLIVNNRISGNSAERGGGILVFRGGQTNITFNSPTILNNTIIKNSAIFGGGIYNYSSASTISNNIISSNDGDGILCENIFYGVIIDFNNVWNNYDSDYCGCTPGPNDISEDPLFIDAENGDYRMQPGSPCIDAGDNDAVPEWLTTDIQGNARVMDGDLDGIATVDMGAAEAEFGCFFTVFSIADMGGTIAPLGEVKVSCGGNQTFTITPEPGLGVADVIVDGESVGTVTSYTFENIHKDHFIHATFAPEFKILSFVADDGGTISPSGEVTVIYGGNQTFTFTPGPGLGVADVIVDGESVGAVTSYTFENIHEDHFIHAIFAPEFKILSFADDGGSISPSGEVTVIYGGNQTFTITPEPGLGVADVIVDGESVGAVTSYTFKNITSNHVIRATFEPSVYQFIVDNLTCCTSQTGTWSISSASGAYGADSLWSRDGATFTWKFNPIRSGTFDVSMWWTEWSSRSTSIPVDIKHAGGTTRVYINQQQNGGKWNHLGTFYMNEGTVYSVKITAQKGPSSTCADAVKFSFESGNLPPIALIDSISPNPAASGQAVTFTGHGTDQDGSIAEYKWTSTLDGVIGSSASFSSSELSQGVHTISFIVRDTDGVWSKVVSGTLSVTAGSEDMVIDNMDANTVRTGIWGVSSAANPYGADSVWSRDGSTFTWKFTPSRSGTYDLGMWWTQYSSRSTSIPVDIGHSGGTSRVYINQQQNGGKWNLLGNFSFSAGITYSVTITSQPGPSSTCADAISLTLTTEPEPGIIMDNRSLAVSSAGTWSISSAANPYGADSVWSRDGSTFTWNFRPTETGARNVSMWWTEWPSRSTSIPVDINHAGGTSRVHINQQTNGGKWNLLGAYSFNAGTTYSIKITAQPGPSSTCADAVKIH
jgi:hypothetical protein